MLAGKIPVFIGAAPMPTSSATRGRRYFLSGKSDDLGLPRLAAKKAKPSKAIKVEKPTMMLSSADATDRLSPLTPTPKSKVSKGKGKAKEVKTDSEIEDDKPLRVSKRRKIPKEVIEIDYDSDFFIDDSVRKIPKQVVDIDDDSDLFIYDSGEVEELAAVSSTRLRTRDQHTKKPRGPTKKKTEDRKGSTTQFATADMPLQPTFNVCHSSHSPGLFYRQNK